VRRALAGGGKVIAIVTQPAVHQCSCYCAARERERSKTLEDALRGMVERCAVMIAIVTQPAVHQCSCYCADRERERSKTLEDALRGMVERWGQHSGLCCTFDAAGKVVVTAESCVCDPLHKQARAALAQGKP